MNERTCLNCHAALNDLNWSPSRQRKNDYVCRHCNTIRRTKNWLYRSSKKIEAEVERLYGQVKDGYVYVITNPAWPEWVKIGMAVDDGDRVNSYQTGSPFRDYRLEGSVYFPNRAIAERMAHGLAEQQSEERRGEWFKMPTPDALQLISTVPQVGAFA